MELLILIFWVGFSVVAGLAAHGKGRSGPGYFLISLFLSPLIGVAAAVVARPDSFWLEERKLKSGEWKRCSYCAEIVRIEARVCRCCGREQSAEVGDQRSEGQQKTGSPGRVREMTEPEGGAQ